MEANVLNTSYRQLLKKSIDVYDKTHQALSQNVANANTDNYKRARTDFSDQLKTAIDNSGVKTTRDKHIQHSNYEAPSMAGPDGQTNEQVDLAREMTELTANQIRHEFVTRALSRHYAGLSTAIVGRNR